MAKKKIFSILTTLADFISNSFIKQRGIRTDGNKSWMFKDGTGNVHVVADQSITDGSTTSYPENHFSPPVLHDVLEVDSEDVEAIGNVLCVDDRSSTYGNLKKISLSDLPGGVPVSGNLTATGAIALDQTRQVIGGAAAISHVDTAGYKHVPTGGATRQFLKYGGASGTSAWADHGLTAADVGALSGSVTDNYVVKGNGTNGLQNSAIYDDGTNVGIGTTSPATRLHIHGTGTQLFRITDDNAAVMTLGISNDAGPFMVMIDAAGTPQIWLSSYGSSYVKGLLGVGVEPSYKLDVSTGANTDIIGRFYGANQSAEYLAFGIQTGTAIITAGHAGSGNNALVIKTSLSGTESEKMRVTSDGKVGIGTASPLTDVEIRPQTGTTVKLTITGDKSVSAVGDEFCSLDFRSGGDTSPQSDNDITGRIVSVSETTNGARAGIAIQTSGLEADGYLSERVRITSGGKVGIGTDAPEDLLDVNGDCVVRGTIAQTADAGENSFNASVNIYGDLDVSTHISAGGQVDCEQLLVGTSAGFCSSAFNVSISAVTINQTCTITDGLIVNSVMSADNSVRLTGLGSGSAVTDINITGTNYLFKVSSSKIFKEDIRPLELDSSLLQKLEVKNYKWKNDETVANHCRGKDDFGFIAEQVAEVCPGLANYNEDGTVQSWKTQKMLVLAVAEIQRQNGRIDALEKHIHQLQGVKNGK